MMPNKKIIFERPPLAPVFKPTLKEFEDPLEYIENIRPVAQKYGICKIISPKQWNPPFAVDFHTFKFRPRVQRLNEIGAHSRIRNNFIRTLEAFWECQNSRLEIPMVKNNRLDLFELHSKVKHYGGCHQVTKNKQWTNVCRELGYGEKSKQLCSTIRSHFEKIIQPYLDFYDQIFISKNPELFPDKTAMKTKKYKTALAIESPKMTRSKSQIANQKLHTECCSVCGSSEKLSSMYACVECDTRCHSECCDTPQPSVTSANAGWLCRRCIQASCQREIARLEAEVFGFSQSNCKYSLESFATYADNFKTAYFNDRKNVSMKEVEEEYWRLVGGDNTQDDVVVKYGADISSGLTSSGFPTRQTQHRFNERDQKYVESGWNLNNLPVLNKSIFRFVSNDISGMTVPWCYVGMVFSCFCWHIEDHWSYSINYLHLGECKTWYGVPESDAEKFEDLMRSEARELFEKSPDLLHHITTQINPTLLMRNNIQVYRTDQAAGEFIVTFPRAYHAGFNQGFNFAEAVNFCPADWLSKGRASVESYRLVKRPSVFSHNELICKMASSLESLDLLLLKAVYDEMVIIQQEEKATRKQICTMVQGACRTERLQLDQISEDDRECLVCRTTLYISGVTCTVCCKENMADRMSCLDHVKSMCSCPNKENIVLKYRYSLDEITALVSNVHKQLEQYKLWMSRVYHLAKSEFCSSPVTAEEGRVMKNVSSFIENLDILREEFNNKNIEEKPNLEELKMLLQIGRSMNIPVYLLDFLEAIIETCQRAMTMTDQLLNSHKAIMKEENKENESLVKSETKSKKGDVKLTKTVTSHEEQAEKLTLGEMRLLVEKLRSLPAHVPQLEEAAQTLHSINEWRKKVRKTVSSIDVIEEHCLTSLIDSAESNLVYLSEYQMLQKMREHTVWIAKSRQLFKSSEQPSPPSLEEFKKIRNEGLSLRNTVEIDRISTINEILELEDEDEPTNDYDETSDFRMMGWNILIENLSKNEKQLSKIIIDGEAMQKKAEDILKSTPGVFALFSLNSLLKNADVDLKCSVSGIDRLKEVVNEAVVVNEKINEMWLKLQQGRRIVHLEDMQSLIKQADSLCVAFDRLSDLKSLNRTIESWKKNLHSLFIKNTNNPYLSTPTLMEVLFPRPQRQFKLMIAREAVSSKLVDDCKTESIHKDSNIKEEQESCDDEKQIEDQKFTKAGNRNFRKSRGRQKRSSVAQDDPQSARFDNVSVFETFLRTPNSGDAEFCGNYKNMCVNELEWMWNLRELNEDKASKDSNGHDFYCFCRKRGMDQKGAQVMCDLCQDWFHLSCLGIQNKDMSKKKFLCPQCERSKRPPFEVILAEKRKLEQEAKMVKIPEHIGLCLMSQRVINFHKHTNQLFSPQTELGAAFAEYKRLFGVQAILPKYNQPGSSVTGQQDHSPNHDQIQDSNMLHLSTGKQSRKTPHSMPKSGIVTGNQAPVTPSTIQLSPIPNKETLLNINRLKSSLSDEARRELEEIYIELCLLEVSQPTVTWIWKLYHSLIDNDDEEIQNQLNSDNENCKREPRVEKLSENSDNSGTEDEAFGMVNMDYMRSFLAQKSSKKSFKIIDENRLEKHIKREDMFSSSDEKRDSMCKFSFKRKLAAKDQSQSYSTAAGVGAAHVKKQSTIKVVKGSTASTRKRGRGGKNVSREVWDFEKNPSISREYYDAENDVILLDKVVRAQEVKSKSKKQKSTSSGVVVCGGSGNLPTNEISRSAVIDESKMISARQQRSSANNRYMKMSMSDKSDYSDEIAPSNKSLEIKPNINQSKRGRKPGSIGIKEPPGATVMKRRRKGGLTGRTASGSKRICNDDCSADMCVQQSSEKVNWVACDMCDQWFHWLCVDIKSELEIEQRFLCPRCKSSKKSRRMPSNIKDEHYIESSKSVHRDRRSSIDDEIAEDIDGDDLNITLDEEVPLKPSVVVTSVVTSTAPIRVTSSASSILDRGKLCTPVDLMSPLCHPEDMNSLENSAFSMNLSPPSLFMQPECCVQEEVVEISYASRSDSDS